MFSKIKSVYSFFQNFLNEIKYFKLNIKRSKANKAISKLYQFSNDHLENNKYIICDGMWDNPHHWLRLAIFLPVLSDFFKAKIMGIYLKDTSVKTLKSLKSFKFDMYQEIDNNPKKIHFENAKELINLIKSPKEIFNLDLPYGFPGNFFYDSILKTEMLGNLSIDKNKISKYLAQLICYLEIYEKLINLEKISAVVLSHPVNLRFSSLVFIALKNNLPVYIINYINEYITIRKLESIEEWKECSHERPKLEEINAIDDSKNNFLEKVGINYLQKIRKSERGQISILGTFKNDKRNTFNKEKFLMENKLDKKKLTAVIMTGCWPDFPNVYPKSFYIDYVDWFKKTLNIILDIEDFNWIIKPHPAEFMYGAKTKSKQFLKHINKENIISWPKELSTNNVINIADVVVTSHGSAGFEYPAQGIPVIITKKTNYTDWGFTNNCFNYKDYKNLLKNINKLNFPTKNEQKMANIFMATHICNASKIDEKYLFNMGALSNKLWIDLEEFILKNGKNFSKERRMINSWLTSNHHSYNFYKSLNFDLWDKY